MKSAIVSMAARVRTRDGFICVRSIPEGSLCGDENRVELEVDALGLCITLHITSTEAARLSQSLREVVDVIGNRKASQRGSV
jgi:hypothetical protein